MPIDQARARPRRRAARRDDRAEAAVVSAAGRLRSPPTARFASRAMGNASVTPPPGTSTSGDSDPGVDVESRSGGGADRGFPRGREAWRVPRAPGRLAVRHEERAKPHRATTAWRMGFRALFEGNPLLTVPPALASGAAGVSRPEPGKEPEEPYLYLDLHRRGELRRSRGVSRGRKPKATGGSGLGRDERRGGRPRSRRSPSTPSKRETRARRRIRVQPLCSTTTTYLRKNHHRLSGR